jgi:hypothetical protein
MIESKLNYFLKKFLNDMDEHGIGDGNKIKDLTQQLIVELDKLEAVDEVTVVMETTVDSKEYAENHRNLTESQRMRVILTETEEAFEQQEYSGNKISFVMVATYNDHVTAKVREMLSPSENLVLDIYTLHMISPNVKLTIEEISERTGLVKNTIRKAQNTLVKYNILIPQTKREQGKTTVYRVNSAIARVGKKFNLKEDRMLIESALAEMGVVLKRDRGVKLYSSTRTTNGGFVEYAAPSDVVRLCDMR